LEEQIHRLAFTLEVKWIAVYFIADPIASGIRPKIHRRIGAR
jgi:hypothetical protein